MMMKKTLLSLATTVALSTQMYAGGHIEPIETEVNVIEEHEVVHEESPFYIIVKGMYILGDKVDHEHAILDGDTDYGYGIDIGYRLGNGFAVEYDFSYSRHSVVEHIGEEAEEGTGKYYTSAIDLVYTIEMTESIGIFGKVGYEYEWETISKFDIDNTNHDFVFGAGVEIGMSEEYKFVIEYEHSLIEGPRGDAIFAGIMYNF